MNLLRYGYYDVNKERLVNPYAITTILVKHLPVSSEILECKSKLKQYFTFSAFVK